MTEEEDGRESRGRPFRKRLRRDARGARTGGNYVPMMARRWGRARTEGQRIPRQFGLWRREYPWICVEGTDLPFWEEAGRGIFLGQQVPKSLMSRAIPGDVLLRVLSWTGRCTELQPACEDCRHHKTFFAGFTGFRFQAETDESKMPVSAGFTFWFRFQSGFPGVETVETI